VNRAGRVKPRFVLACDRCDRLIVADHIAPLCRRCHERAGDWTRPFTVREFTAAANQARKLQPVERPARQKNTTRKEKKQ